jgi:hypothetical protein
MVARRGNAPRSAGCEPAALLLSYRAMKKKWHPHPVMLRGLRLLPLCSWRSAFVTCASRRAFLVENQACCYCTARPDTSLPFSQPPSRRADESWRSAKDCRSGGYAECAPRPRLNGALRHAFEPWTPVKVRLFSRQRPRPTGRAPFVKWLLPLASHQAHTA